MNAQKACAQQVSVTIPEFEDFVKVVRYQPAPAIDEFCARHGSAALDLPGVEGKTALMWAIFHERKSTVEALLNAGASIDQAGSDGRTALIWAVRWNRHSMLELLAKKGAHLNAQDNTGATALMHAAAMGRTPNAELLLAHQADASLQDQKGWTALMYADERKDRALALIVGRAAIIQRQERSRTLSGQRQEMLKRLRAPKPALKKKM